MKLLRNIIYFALLALVLFGAMAFSALNPDPMELDLAFGRFTVNVNLAMLGAFAAGWLFGVLCASLLILRSVGERRRLRRAAEVAKAEVQALRSLPGEVAE